MEWSGKVGENKHSPSWDRYFSIGPEGCTPTKVLF